MKGLLAVAACAAFLASSSSAQVWRGYIHEPSSARVSGTCVKRSPVAVGGTQGYSDALNSGKCFVSIDPISTPGLVYRSYAFFGDGLLMVFSSYGDGDMNSNLTSAREFFFFPRRGAPELAMDPKGGTVSVLMSDGGRADFAAATAQIASVDRGAVSVSPRIDPAERGGVEFAGYAGLMLDAGFRVGESPSGRPNATSTFHSAEGQLCTVTNRDLFNYTPDGDHVFKFTDVQLAAWLQTACPGLHVGF